MDKFRDTTKRLLSESLKKLMLDGVSFDKITIKDITQTAGLIRPTFYNHFHDKYELLEWILQSEVFEPSYMLLDLRMFDEAYRMILTRLNEERPFYAKAISIEGQNSFAQIMFSCFERLLRRYLAQQEPDVFPADFWATAESLAKYCANSFTYLITMWLSGKVAADVDDMYTIYQYVSTHSLGQMLAGQGWLDTENQR